MHMYRHTEIYKTYRVISTHTCINILYFLQGQSEFLLSPITAVTLSGHYINTNIQSHKITETSSGKSTDCSGGKLCVCSSLIHDRFTPEETSCHH